MSAWRVIQLFSDAMIALVLGDKVSQETVAAVATPGGTGAFRQALELVKLANPSTKIWISSPTWPNHPSIINYVGINIAEYRYFNNDTRAIDFEGMIEDLGNIRSGDVVLLHACCHNPTGANLTQAQWSEVITLMQQNGAIPLIDIAYQGFGDGLEEDAAGLRMVASEMPETLIGASCSKNFGIYRERTGILMAVSQDKSLRTTTQTNLEFLNRQNYSFPPDHGARLVSLIMNDDTLRADWKAEIENVRLGMLKLREQLARELRQRSGSDRFGFLAEHRGMFSRLGATPEQVESLRRDYGIYMVGDSRLNIAGLNAKTVPILAEAVIKAGI